MHRLKRSRAAVAGAIAAFVAVMASVAVAITTDATAVRPHRDVALILHYQVAQPCQVFPNYPKPGVKGNEIGWTIAPGQIVSWRYNVNGHWAMISDQKFEHSSAHPWWGFVPRVCIGGSVGGEHFPTPTSSYPAGVHIPTKILQGRSAVTASHYRSVDFRVSSGHVVEAHKLIRTKGTLRDARGRFVIGNVSAGWHVQRTNVHDGPWTKVYVPNADRWGWVEDIHF